MIWKKRENMLADKLHLLLLDVHTSGGSFRMQSSLPKGAEPLVGGDLQRQNVGRKQVWATS